MTSLPPLASPTRHISVDALRGFVMFAMIFVNDVAGVPHVPAWMEHHEPPYGNGMTFVDVVFPAFLFVVGLSLPLAFENRRRKGDSTLKLLGHVLLRTLSLLLIGVFMVNMDGFNAWSFLVLLAAVAAYLSAPRWPRKLVLIIRIAGFATLGFLAVSYLKSGNTVAISPPHGMDEWRQRIAAGSWLHTQWWGILGLIGWAYLVASVVYLVTRGSRLALSAAVSLTMAMFYADQIQKFPSLLSGWWLPDGWNVLALAQTYVDFGSMIGSQAGITLCGVLLGTILLSGAPEQTHLARVRFATLMLIPLLLGAVLTYPAFGVNKNIATPSWCLISAAITTFCFIIAYVITEAIGFRSWAWPLIGCGGNALLAYLSQSIFIRAIVMTHHHWHGAFGRVSLAFDISQSLFIAAALTCLAAALNQLSIRLKL